LYLGDNFAITGMEECWGVSCDFGTSFEDHQLHVRYRQMILFFHGLIGSRQNFRFVESQLEGCSSRIFNPDLDFFEHPMDELIDLTRTAIRDKDRGRTNISVGNSLGCLLALELADEVDKIILTAPMLNFEQFNIPRDKKVIREYTTKLISNNFYVMDVLKQDIDESVDKLHNVVNSIDLIRKLKRVKKEILSYDMDSILNKYQDKIHIVLGADDSVTPPQEYCEYARTVMPGAKITILEGCGHAVPLQKPDELAAIIKSYL